MNQDQLNKELNKHLKEGASPSDILKSIKRSSGIPIPPPNKMNKGIEQVSGINQKTFNQLLKSAGLTDEEINQKIGDLSIPWKDDRAKPAKTATEEQKVILYDKLRVWDLPFDWELRLEKLKVLDTKQDSVDTISAELKNWTEAFPNQKPQDVKNKIEQLEKDKKELDTKLNEKIKQLEKDLADEKTKNGQTTASKDTEISGLKAELSGWQNLFNNKPLDKAKEEYNGLLKRPKLSITVKEFWEDYARRWTREHSNKILAQLQEAENKRDQYFQSRQRLWRAFEKYMRDELLQKYIFAKSIITKEQAENAIKDLLLGVDNHWGDYLEQGNITNKNLNLAMNIVEDSSKKALAEQVLGWVRETRNGQMSYQQLFINWAGGTSYNKNNELDGGSLYFLSSHLEKYLSIKNFGTPTIEEKPM